MKLSDYLKEYRKVNNLTQQDLADKLFVTKQAVSKWETERGLPDIETYRELSKLLNVSVDELLGLDKKEEELKKSNKKLFLIILITSIILVLSSIIVIGIVISNNKPKPNEVTNELDLEILEKANYVQEMLGFTLPSITSYDFLDFTEWKMDGNSQLPDQMFYLEFKEDLEIDHTWMRQLSDDILNSIPIMLGDIPNTCDYFKLFREVEKEEVDTILKSNEPIKYVLYSYMVDLKRLIVINFSY